jgi:hypothetical protein
MEMSGDMKHTMLSEKTKVLNSDVSICGYIPGLVHRE